MVQRIGNFMLVLVIGLVAGASATVRSISQDDHTLFLHEKIGRVENRWDNPAWQTVNRSLIVENYTDIAVSNRQPVDPVFEKNDQDELVVSTTQLLFPFEELLYFNFGMTYLQQLIGQTSRSTLDDSYINETYKSFGKRFNAALAVEFLPNLPMGYSLKVNQAEQYVALVSDLASDYDYFNERSSSKHQVGVAWRSLDVVLGYTDQTYLGKYNDVQEIDFRFSSLMIQIRHLLGEVDKKNLMTTVNYQTHQLTQRQFDIARSDYDLQFFNYQLTINSFYYYPQTGWEAAFGLEASLDDKSIFDIGAYEWQSCQVTQVDFPAMLGVTILPWLKAWFEFRLAFDHQSRENDYALYFQNALGLSVARDGLTIELYTLPQGRLVQSANNANQQALVIGIDVQLKFPSFFKSFVF